MITKEIELYPVQELTLEAKKKAWENWKSENSYDFLSGHLHNMLWEYLQDEKVELVDPLSRPNVLYSLSHSQGDGAMFEGSFTWNYTPEGVNQHNNQTEYRILITHHGRYYHANSKNISMTTELDGEEVEANEEAIKAFEEIYQRICMKLEKDGYEFIEYEDSEEAFEQACEANEYLFRADGTMENE